MIKVHVQCVSSASGHVLDKLSKSLRSLFAIEGRTIGIQIKGMNSTITQRSSEDVMSSQMNILSTKIERQPVISLVLCSKFDVELL